MRSVVVLPAPLGPSRPRICAGLAGEVHAVHDPPAAEMLDQTARVEEHGHDSRLYPGLTSLARGVSVSMVRACQEEPP